MKIKHFWISKYKNIEDQTFDFNGTLISLFVGKNGLGKSNLFEAIAVIFRNLDLADKESDITNEFDYIIEYEVKGHYIKISNIGTELSIDSKKIESENEFTNVKIGSFKTHRASRYLPDYIIGYYSGENKRIKDLFSRHIEKREYNLKRSSPSIDAPLLGKMFFSDQLFGELIFFTLWVFKDSSKYGEKIKQLLNDFVTIDNVTDVSIEFSNPVFYKKTKEDQPDKEIENIHSNIANEVEFPFWGSKGRVNDLLKVLYNNHIDKSEPISFRDEEYDHNKGRDEFIIFNKLDYNKLHEDLEKEGITSPIYLFDSLLAADSIESINKIETKISRFAEKISHNYNGLSEGEQQLLTVLGLTLISGEYDTLFILDEPDTHLNPSWQRDYVQLINKFTLESNNSQILIATHSPLIVQSSENADVFLFKKEGDGVKIESEDYKIHNWRIDHVLMSEYFGLDSARPPALDEFMYIRNKYLKGETLSDDEKQVLGDLVNSFDVLPTGETVNDIVATKRLYEISK